MSAIAEKKLTAYSIYRPAFERQQPTESGLNDSLYNLQIGDEEEGVDNSNDVGGEEVKEQPQSSSAVDLTGQFVYSRKLQEVLKMEGGAEQRETLLQLFLDFEEAAKKGALTIVDELNLPLTKKSIQPLDIGGIAGGTKFIHEGILYKLARDAGTPDGYLYGGDKPSALFAGKAAANELKASNTLLRMFFDKRVPITLPLQILLDYNGWRIVAMSVLPLGKDSQFIYGSSDGGKTVHADNPTFNALIKAAAQELHLAEHKVQKVMLCMAGDVEGHMDADGNFYLLDLARMWPPEQPPPEVSERAIFYRLLRPEFLKEWKRLGKPPLSPDALSGWGMANRREHNQQVIAASTYLVGAHIPVIVAKLEHSVVKDRVVVSELFEQAENLSGLMKAKLLAWLTPFEKQLTCPLIDILPLLPWFFKQHKETDISAQFEREEIWAKAYGKVLATLNLANVLHRHGISLRHLKYMHDCVKLSGLKDKFFLEMTKRSVKTMVRFLLADGKKTQAIDLLNSLEDPSREMISELSQHIVDKYLHKPSSDDQVVACVRLNSAEIANYVRQTCGLEIRSKPNTFIMLVNAKTQYDRAVNERDDRATVVNHLSEAAQLCKQIRQSDPDDEEAKDLNKRCEMLLALKNIATTKVIDAVRTAQAYKMYLNYFFKKLETLPAERAVMRGAIAGGMRDSEDRSDPTHNNGNVNANGNSQLSAEQKKKEDVDAELVGLFQAVIDDDLKCLLFAEYLDHQAGRNFFAPAMSTNSADEALRMACRGGRGECVRLLLVLKADANCRDEDETSALAAAAFEGHTNTVQILVDGGALIKGSGALIAAASNGHPATTELLLKLDPQTSDEHKQEALVTAAKNGHSGVVRTLIRARADVAAVMGKAHNSHMRQILDDARQEAERPEVGGSQGLEEDTLVFAWGTTLREKAATAAHLLLTAGADPNYKIDEEPILMRAVANNDFAIVQALLLQKADPNVRYRGRTALQWASSEGMSDIVTVLVNANADINAVDDGGMSTALSSAARWGHTHVVKLLLEQKADVHKGERTPLMWCAEWSRIDGAKLLLESKANVNHVKGVRTALSWGVRWRQPTFVKFLLESRADPREGEPPGALVNWTVSNCKSPFSKAIEQMAAAQPGFDAKMGDTAFQIVELLVTNKAELHKDSLRTAASMNRSDIVKLLLRARAEPDVESLSLAINENCVDIVESLLDANANVNATNDEGVKPLLSAIRVDNQKVVALLLEHKADLALIDTSKAKEITSAVSPEMQAILRPHCRVQ